MACCAELVDVSDSTIRFDDEHPPKSANMLPRARLTPIENLDFMRFLLTDRGHDKRNRAVL